MSDAVAILMELRAILERIETKLGSAAGISSVEVRTSTRGVDVSTKAYVGSDIHPAGDAAVSEYFRVVREIERRLVQSEGA